MTEPRVISARVLAVDRDTWPAFRRTYVDASAHVPEGLDIRARVHPPAAPRQGAIAIVPVEGALTRRGDWVTDILGWTTYDGLAQQLSALASDRSIASIVLRVDSPGGTVYGADDAAQAVADAAKKKPVIAVADGLMASAAYWIASAATEIVATPGAEVGSIGVIGVHFDRSAALSQMGIVATEITAGEHKGEGSPLRPLSDEDRAAIQARIDAHYELFTARVARGRKVSVDAVRAGFGQGRALTAKDALKAGLVDRIGRLSDTIDTAIASSTTSTSRASADADLRLMARLRALRG